MKNNALILGVILDTKRFKGIHRTYKNHSDGTYKKSQRTNHSIKGILLHNVFERKEGRMKNICFGDQANKTVYLLRMKSTIKSCLHSLNAPVWRFKQREKAGGAASRWNGNERKR